MPIVFAGVFNHISDGFQVNLTVLMNLLGLVQMNHQNCWRTSFPMAPKRSRLLMPPAMEKPRKSARVESVLKPGEALAKSGQTAKQSTLKKVSCSDLMMTKGVLVAPTPLEQMTLSPRESESKKGTAMTSISSSSDSSSEAELAEKRKRNLHTRAKHRRRKYVDLLMDGKDPRQLSLLERQAIGSAAEKMYQTELKAFKEFAVPLGLEVNKPSKVDQLMTQYMNRCFLDGHQAFVGNRLVASWMYHYPEYSKSGTKRIPHALRALKGWRKLCPGRSRVPYPLAIWCGMAALMMEMGFPKMAEFLMLSLSTYTRPSELLRLRVFSLLRPAQGITSCWGLLLSPEKLG